MKLTYKGYVVSQSSNNHVMIFKNKEMVFHSSCNKKLTEEQLKKTVDFYLKLITDKEE